MKKVFCLFAFSALTLASCSSSDSSSSGTNEEDVLVTKTIETYANDGSVITTNFTYNGKKIVKASDSDGYYEKYTYTGDLVTQVKYYDSDDVLGEIETFAYNSSGQVISYVREEPLDDIGFKETYVYNGDGTITATGYSGDTTTQDTQVSTSTIHFSGSEVSTIELDMDWITVAHAYTYDTKNNPFMNVTGFDKILFVDSEAIGIHHNMLTDTEANDFSGTTIVTTSTFTYNAMNFPLTCSEIEDADADSVITTEYIYN